MSEPLGELLYAYAVTRPADRLDEELREAGGGVSGGPVFPLYAAELAAVVTAVPESEFGAAALREHLEDLGRLEAMARAHQRVVDAVFAAGCALPLRLATVFRSEDAVRRMLGEGHERLGRALDRLDGRVEWGVKVHQVPLGLGESTPSASRDSPAGDGRDYLRARLRRRRAADDAVARAAAFAEELHARLRRHSEAQRILRPQDGQLDAAHGRNVFNAAYLVPRSEREFAETVRAWGERDAGFRVELTGPWAPYSFAEALE